MSSSPLVSAIVSVYNGEAFIAGCINSMLAQTWSPLEIIICDDGSTDSTAEIIKSFGNKVTYIYQDNQGQGAGRNKAAAHAKGEYLAFLDADDAWLPKKIEKQMQVLLKNEELAGVYSDMKVINPEGKLLRYNAKGRMKRGMIFDELLGGNYMCGLSSLMLRRKYFLEAHGFSSHRYCQDFVLLIKLAFIYPFDFVDEPLVLYLEHEHNITKNIDISYPEGIEVYKNLDNQLSLSVEQRIMAKVQLGRLYHAYAWLTFLKGNVQKAWQIIREAEEASIPLFWKTKLLKASLRKPLLFFALPLAKWYRARKDPA